LFVANQRQWRHAPLGEDEIEVFRRVRDETGINPVVAHSSYLINLAAVDRAVARKSLSALAEEYGRCHRLGIDYLVLHPGAHMGAGVDKGLHKIGGALNRILDQSGDSDCRLLLENTAGQGTCVGHTFEQLAGIIDKIEQKDRVGVCLDTSHIFAAGYDIRTPATYKQTMRRLENTIGLKKLAVIHMNDSKTDLNGRVDRHEHIGKGAIGRQGFHNFLKDKRLRKLAFIIETPKGLSPGGRDLDSLNLNALRRLAKK
ncbi:MAG: deoxyribonuclease IV, partial [Sedimentisphaerales bacterium]|nr:deoxyribonuclease IV [Sedimentisphaerales bacterium]